MRPGLETLRAELDRVDSKLVETLGRRFQICCEIARVKQAEQIPMMQTDRISLVKKRAAEIGQGLGIREDFIEKLYDLVIGEACRLEQEIIDTPASAAPKSHEIHPSHQ
jgi:4-amino-4-deoxychorismate mutase